MLWAVQSHALGNRAGKVLTVLLFLFGAPLLDRLARPRPAGTEMRSLAGLVLLWLLAAIPFGFFLAVGGNPGISVGLALAAVGLLTMVSNAKRAMLGEALVFSDLALLGAVFKHPQFYFSALSRVQKMLLAMAAPIVPLLVWLTRTGQPEMHLSGILILLGSSMMLRIIAGLPPWSRLAPHPDSEADVLRHGLVPTLLLHWIRWRASRDPQAPVHRAERVSDDELVIMIQCESFADPVELFADPALELPGLTSAQQCAWQHGRLHVHGFGAYTMRTEYGVLFGRHESALGFRRFDPYLTALGEAHHALPARLMPAGWRSLFVHPHDMRFYSRDKIMPAAGFAELCGEDRFTRPGAKEGRYVTDAAMADEILALAENASQPTLIYAVTIENHGPWGGASERRDLRECYVDLVRRSDAMLARLASSLSGLGRPATLVFFGDHRPSIPGVADPGGDLHTPYVILRFDGEGQVLRGRAEPHDLTPADLHHTVLNLLVAEAVPATEAADQTSRAAAVQ